MDVTSILIFSVIILIYIYFGYKDDYKRDKNGFKIGCFGVIGTFIIFYIFLIVENIIEKPIKQFFTEHKIEQIGLLLFQFLYFSFLFLILMQFNKFVKRKLVKDGK